jgi:TatD family-associated radical SAM protein
VYGSDSLWLEREPTVDEVKSEFEKFPPESYNEVVFCGYGEPFERFDDMVSIAIFAKQKYNKQVRVNTNGLGNLICEKPCESALEGAIDTVSISLNAPDRDEYNSITRPKWKNAYDEMLQFAVNVKPYVKKVMFTIVDLLSEEDTQKCVELAERLGIELRIRKFE